MKRKILLVEDHPDSADVMRRQLKLLGYESVLANDGEEAEKMVVSESPDLILMDISLPKKDGLQATRLIRQNPHTRSIPIIAVTARSLPADRDKALKAGCDDYLTKPFSGEQLERAVKRLLKT
jgi:two-component system response regulator